jgi:hypothetical protein
MDYLVAALIMVMGVGAMAAIYRLRSPEPFPPRKPGFCWFPKYLVPMDFPGEILHSSNPISVLEGRLSPLGFQLEESSKGEVKFRRGFVLGDISVKLVKVEMIFPAALDGNRCVTVQYGFVAAFDTGDLWTLASEVREHIQAAA